MSERSENKILRESDFLNITIVFSEILHSCSLVCQIGQKMMQTANKNTYMSTLTIATDQLFKK